MIIQNQSGTLFDRVFKIFVKPNDSEEPLNLFTFETELGVNVNFKILKCEQLTDAYFDEGNNSPIMANVLLNFTYDYAFSDGEITALVSFFIVNPEIGEISIKIVDVKILSPKTLKYEPSKTIEDLKNETNDAGKKTITYIQEQLMPKGDVGFANPLEKQSKKTILLKLNNYFLPQVLRPTCIEFQNIKEDMLGEKKSLKNYGMILFVFIKVVMYLAHIIRACSL